MQVKPYPDSHSMQVKLDWLELRCLENDFFIFRMSELRNLLENLDAYSSNDIGEEDAKVESEITKLLAQMTFREGLLADSYPFRFNTESDSIELVAENLQELSIDKHAYLYCLYFSHITQSKLFDDINRDFSPYRDLLQITGTIALAGFVQGHSVSFGWPRPQGENYYTALNRVIDLIGEGRVKPLDEVNAYLLTRQSKDAGIDVIAWSEDNPRDTDPGGRIIFFVQVASGLNWRDKPVKPDLEKLQEHWLSRRIPRVHDAIIIPFDFEFDDETQRKDFLEYIAHEFGVIFYRLRLPQFFKKGLRLIDETPRLLIERGGDIQRLSQFVIDVTGDLQGDAA